MMMKVAKLKWLALITTAACVSLIVLDMKYPALRSASGEASVPGKTRDAACLALMEWLDDGTAPPEELEKSEAAPPLKEVQLVLQNPELPNGCEVTSLAMLLSATGVQADKLELHSDYLPREDISIQEGTSTGPDPSKAYVGDASESSGWYCFEDPVLAAGNDWLEQQGLPWRMESDTGVDREQLEQYLEQGRALIAWVTLEYEDPITSSYTWYLPDGTEYTPYSNLHCVVLTGWDGEDYLVANPIEGWQTVTPQDFWNAFDAMGRRLVTLTPGAEFYNR